MCLVCACACVWVCFVGLFADFHCLCYQFFFFPSIFCSLRFASSKDYSNNNEVKKKTLKIKWHDINLYAHLNVHRCHIHISRKYIYLFFTQKSLTWRRLMTSLKKKIYWKNIILLFMNYICINFQIFFSRPAIKKKCSRERRNYKKERSWDA